MTRHVILGAGPAGLNAIETIRQFDTGGSITLVAGEPPYSRMALPYLLSGEVTADRLATASADTFERWRVDARLDRRAAAVDTRARTVRLDNQETIAFDTLLIATGSSPVRPPIPGIDGKNVFNLWTLADANQVMGRAGNRPSAVLIGGGFVGLIVLNALYKRGWKLTLVEMEDHVLPRMLDRQGAECVERWLRDRGIGVYTGCGVENVESARTRKKLRLTNGQTLTAQMVIVSAGVQPNLKFLEGSGIAGDRGVVVDRFLESNVQGIFAAGDAAQGPDLLGGAAVHAIQPTAVDHGRVAGANMAGQRIEYPGSLLINTLDIAGLHCASFGRWQDGAGATVVLNARQPVYRKLAWAGTRLAGGIILGPSEDSTMLNDVGMLKGLVQTQVDLGDWKTYLRERPWDLRRAYVASGAAQQLLRRTTLRAPSRPRAFRFGNQGPRTSPTEHHAVLIGTQPDGFGALPPTPTPGIHKAREGKGA